MITRLEGNRSNASIGRQVYGYMIHCERKNTITFRSWQDTNAISLVV